MISWAHHLITRPSSTSEHVSLPWASVQLSAAQTPGAVQNGRQPVVLLSMAAHPLAAGFFADGF